MQETKLISLIPLTHIKVHLDPDNPIGSDYPQLKLENDSSKHISVYNINEQTNCFVKKPNDISSIGINRQSSLCPTYVIPD